MSNLAAQVMGSAAVNFPMGERVLIQGIIPPLTVIKLDLLYFKGEKVVVRFIRAKGRREVKMGIFWPGLAGETMH